MNINNLYIADLRIVTSCKQEDLLYENIGHRHLKFILVKSNENSKYEDTVSKNKEAYPSYGNTVGEKFIDPRTLYPFSDCVNKCFNKNKTHMRKRKVLSLIRECNEVYNNRR